MEMLGAMTVLPKPLDAEAFLAVLRNAIHHGKRLQR
jgi:hypothetical protein